MFEVRNPSGILPVREKFTFIVGFASHPTYPGHSYGLPPVLYNYQVLTFDTFEGMVEAFKYKWTWLIKSFETPGCCRTAVLYDDKGNPLNLVETLRYVRNQEMMRWADRYPGYVRRNGPVHGIRKWRGGGGHSIRVIPETRLNALVVKEDGEVPARPARMSLPDPWDYDYRCVQRSWKTQRRGLKAWDRQ